ncbi:MAG: hypothetical protein RLZZ436_1714, partial [Planctomycetota bacterium]
AGGRKPPGAIRHPGAHPSPRRQQHCERSGGSPRLRSGTLVPTPPRGVSSAWPRVFTRGLPPCGSSVAEAPGCVSAPWCPALPVASAARSQEPLPAGFRPAAQVWRKPPIAFCTLVPGLHAASAARSQGLFTRGLPPCGSAFLPRCGSVRLPRCGSFVIPISPAAGVLQ